MGSMMTASISWQGYMWYMWPVGVVRDLSRCHSALDFVGAMLRTCCIRSPPLQSKICSTLVRRLASECMARQFEATTVPELRAWLVRDLNDIVNSPHICSWLASYEVQAAPPKASEQTVPLWNSCRSLLRYAECCFTEGLFCLPIMILGGPWGTNVGVWDWSSKDP